MDLYSRYVSSFPAALIKLEKIKATSKSFDAIVKVRRSLRAQCYQTCLLTLVCAVALPIGES